MTLVREIATTVDEVMQKTKKGWVAKNPDQTDLGIYVHTCRGEEIVATLVCKLDRDRALEACRVAAMAMAATAVTCSFESWHSSLGKSPITKQDWRPGEMEFLAKTLPKAREKHWVDECITTNAYDRDGNYAIISRSYVIEDGKVTFNEPEVFDSSELESKGGGYMHDRFVSMMKEPTILELMEQEDVRTKGLAEVLLPDSERREFHMDVAALRILMDRELITAAALLAKDGSLRSKLIAGRFGDGVVKLWGNIPELP